MKISQKYGIPARNLDFLNIDLRKDNKFFIDPLRIKAGDTEFHKICYSRIEQFVDILLYSSHKKEYNKLLEFIENFYERNETRLGYSIDTVYGKSFGENGGTELIRSLSKNEVLDSGFVEDIFDFLIMVPNIGEDKVSDLITTFIFSDLLNYTQEQCKIWKIPTETVNLNKKCWNPIKEIWEKREEQLPVDNGKAIVFVPKSFIGKNFLFSYEKLYRELIIPLYKQLELNNKNSKFVVNYKNGRTHVLGNELRKEYPCTKYVILDFVKKYDIVYREYKNKILENYYIE